MVATYKHYSEYTGPWPWANFTAAEVACKHCGELYIDHHALNALQILRNKWAAPIIINSAHRCSAHNKAVGGAASSQHLKIAFDCRMPKDQQASFIALARACGFTGIGTYDNFVHLDTRATPAEWQG